MQEENVARGVASAMGQETLKAAAVKMEETGDWRAVSVQDGRITLESTNNINWWVHGTLALFTVFLSLIWTAKVAKKPRGTVTLVLDELGRVRQLKS